MIRTLLSFTAIAFAVGTTAHAQAPAPAAAYPTKPIRLIVPFPPGGGTDILARVVSNKLTEVSKWTVVPDNRAGAGGTIGITEAAKAAPTGYDMVMGQKDNVVLGPYLYKNLPWNPVKDLVPVAHVAYTPVVIATSVNSKYKTLADVVAAAKAAPGTITYGSPGNGTSIHLAGHLFEQAAGAKLSHIPYKGSNPALMDALAIPKAILAGYDWGGRAACVVSSRTLMAAVAQRARADGLTGINQFNVKDGQIRYGQYDGYTLKDFATQVGIDIPVEDVEQEA